MASISISDKVDAATAAEDFWKRMGANIHARFNPASTMFCENPNGDLPCPKAAWRVQPVDFGDLTASKGGGKYTFYGHIRLCLVNAGLPSANFRLLADGGIEAEDKANDGLAKAIQWTEPGHDPFIEFLREGQHRRVFLHGSWR